MVELREVLVEIGFSLGGDGGLIRRFAVSAIKFLHHIHSGCHLTERGKVIGPVVQAAAIVGKIYKYLRSAGTGSCSGVTEEAGFITLGNGIIFDRCLLPS